MVSVGLTAAAVVCSTVSDLSPKDKDDFARRWCHLTELPERRGVAIAELVRDIHSTDRIELLTGNPMLLTILALVKRKVGKLPRRPAELYWEAVQVLVNWRSEVDQPIDSREALPQLEYLAYAMCARGKQQLREDEVLELFERMRSEYPKVYLARSRSPVEFLHLLERRTGILVEAGHARHEGMTVPVFEFRHLTFQEYLAALALVHGRFPNRDRSLSIAQHIAPLARQTGKSAEPWREALRLCVACANDDEVDALLGAIVTPIEEQESASRALLAILCLADEPNTSEDVAQDILREFVRQIVAKRLKPSNRDLMEIAGCLWAPSLCSVLYEQYVCSDASTRPRIGEVYGTLLASKAPNSQLEITEWLLARISSGPRADPRTAIEVALSAHHFAVRTEIQLSQEIVDFLVSMFTIGSAAAFAASRVLFRIVRTFQRFPVKRGDLRKGNRSTLGSPQLASLSEYLSKDWAEPATARHIIAILGLGKYHSAAPVIVPWLKSSDPGVSSVAALTLGGLDAGFALKDLIELLSASQPSVRRSAIKGISLLSGQDERAQASGPILALLSDSNAGVSIQAAQAIAQLAQPEMTGALLSALETALFKRAVGIVQAGETARS